MKVRFLSFCLALSACHGPTGPEQQAGIDASNVAPTSASASGDLPPDANVDSPSDTLGPEPTLGCPEGTELVSGGLSWMGTDYDVDESPRHQVAVKAFCLDKTEVTVALYNACVEAGKCTPSRQDSGCTAYAKGDRKDHPINCVDWNQASAACAAWGKRLPTEREWEYAASGGPEHRRFSWGNQDPRGRSCYDQATTCSVGSYPEGAYGLHDMSGNVWEWTSSWFGPYPDEPASGSLRVYRGGSFSRRFPRWMRTGLRNRYKPTEYGAHLGFRCAQDLAGSECPAGSQALNGGCEVPGVKRLPPRPMDWVPAAASVSATPESAPVVGRDTRYDDDCLKYKPGRPICYQIQGGSFADRQRVGGGRGCVNRDVGIGYNSICCKN